MKRRTKRRSLATPDLTPLIDVVFLLLIFFMLVTTFNKYTGFNLELPKGEFSEIENSDKNYELIIDKDNKVFLSIDEKSEPIMLEEIPEKVKNIKEISITADKDLKYQEIVNMIGILKNSGVEKVELNFYE